jgi:hypothetical protein
MSPYGMRCARYDGMAAMLLWWSAASDQILPYEARECWRCCSGGLRLRVTWVHRTHATKVALLYYSLGGVGGLL